MKIRLENDSDASIYIPHLQARGKDVMFENEMTVVPRQTRKEIDDAAATGQKTMKATPGSAMIDVTLWNAVKDHKAVVAYLTSKPPRLRVVGDSGPPPEPATAGTGKGGGR